MSNYMTVLLISGIFPLLLSFYPPLKFYGGSNKKALSLSILLIILIFGAWDVFATWRGHWSFDPSGVWPVRITNLPVEEVLFFVVIPFCCLFTWEVLKYISGSVKR